jgi:hypothetical protein
MKNYNFILSDVYFLDFNNKFFDNLIYLNKIKII